MILLIAIVFGIIFAAQGEPPFRLLAGSRDALLARCR